MLSESAIPAKEPLIGIVVLNYNQPGYTLECVQDLLRNETYPRFEIVVVDNASPDRAGVEWLKQSLPEQVHFIAHKTNGGYSAGNNIGAKYMIGERHAELIYILNNDTLAGKPVLHRLVEALNDPGIGAVSPVILHDDMLHDWRYSNQVRRLLSFGQMMIVNSGLLSRLPFFRRMTDAYLYRDQWPWQEACYRTDTINGAAFLIRADLMREMGYLDEGFFLFLEELALGYRLRQMGYSCALQASVQVLHHQGKSTGAGRAGFSRTMFRHLMDSFDRLGSEYYKVAAWQLRLYRGFRQAEQGIKKVWQWMAPKR